MTAIDDAWAMLARSEVVADADAVDAALERLAAAITAGLSQANPLVLVLMRGAMVFAGWLLPRLRFPLEVDYVDLSRYGEKLRGGEVSWRVEPPAQVRGRVVLALDDILDGGQTLCAVRERVLALGAKRFQCAVLVEKQLAHAKPIVADFVGLPVPDRFVFGCGMDARGLWRNLPEIRALREG